MYTFYKVVLVLSPALSCWSAWTHHKHSGLAGSGTAKTPVTPATTTPSQAVPDDSGISHIIEHSKLFTEFVSFAVNPARSMETVDSFKSRLSKLPQHPANETKSLNGTSDLSILENVQSNTALQDLFIEMTKRNSPGFIVSFDYLNVTAKSSAGESMSREPVRMWGILPDELGNKTLYFLADYYASTVYDAETLPSAREQIDDFELWKNETLVNGELVDNKLGDGTIGALLG